MDEVITERGGQTSTGTVSRPVTHALLKLKQHGFADNPERGIWSIFSAGDSFSEETFRVETLDQFTEWAKKFDLGDCVFRGVPNEDYGIQASAYRRPEENYRDFDKFLQINEELIEEATQRGYDERNGRKMMDLEILAELQHYGAATCLIDFSYSAQIALWFACQPGSKVSQDAKDPPNGKVFAVYKHPPNFQEIKSDDLSEKINQLLQDGENSQLYHWQPRQQNNRIIAQQSIFLFGNYEFDPYDQCVVAEDKKRDILVELQQVAGITEAMLFPDFDGFARLRSMAIPYTQLQDYEYREVAYNQFQQGNYSEAIIYCNRAIAKNSDYADAYYVRGLVQQQLEQHSDAISDFDRFLNLNSEYAEGYYYRAESKFHLHSLDDAKDDLQTAYPLAEKDGNRRLMASILILLDEIDSRTVGEVQDE